MRENDEPAVCSAIIYYILSYTWHVYTLHYTKHLLAA